MFDKESLILLIQLAGVGHISLALGSLLIPKAMNWGVALKNTPNLIRQMFWAYGGYTFGVNVFFGLVSVLYPSELILGSGLSMSLTLFICLYWFTRIIIQFFYFDRSGLPNGFWYKLSEWVLILAFATFSSFYGLLYFLSINDCL